MATDIYSMLTGGSNDPFGDQANRQQEAFQQRLMQSTDPRAFIATVGGNLGSQLGMGANRLLTGGTPEEKKNRLKQEAMAEVQASGIDLSDQVAVLKAIMTALQKRGLTAEAMAVGSQMPKPEKDKLSTLGLLFKEQEKYEEGSAGFIAYQKAIDKETASAVAKDPAVGTDAELIAQTKYNKPFASLSAVEKQEVYKEIQSTKKNSLGSGLTALAEAITKETGKGVGKDVAEAVSPVVLQGKENTLAALKRAQDLLTKNDGIYTGGLASAKMAASKYTPFGSQKKLENTEKYLAYVSTTVIPLLKEFGGNDSNEELKFLQRLVGGEITLEEETLKEIISSAITKTERGIKRSQEAAKAASEGKMPSTEVQPQNLGAQPTPIGVGETTSVNGVTITRVK
jgi:hypothetical protein